MKIDCDKAHDRRLARSRRLHQWHDHFALWPRRLGKNDCRWLETIERRRSDSYYFTYWEYRAKRSTDD